MTEAEAEFWTEADMLRRYGYSSKTLQRLRAHDRLPSFKARHGPRLYPVAKVLKWEAERTTATAPPGAEPEAPAKKTAPARGAVSVRQFGRSGRKGGS